MLHWSSYFRKISLNRKPLKLLFSLKYENFPFNLVIFLQYTEVYLTYKLREVLQSILYFCQIAWAFLQLRCQHIFVGKMKILCKSFFVKFTKTSWIWTHNCLKSGLSRYTKMAYLYGLLYQDGLAEILNQTTEISWNNRKNFSNHMGIPIAVLYQYFLLFWRNCFGNYSYAILHWRFRWIPYTLNKKMINLIFLKLS